MTRVDLETFKYELESIKIQMEYIEDYKSRINKLTSEMSDMPSSKGTVHDKEAEKLANVYELLDKLKERISENSKRQMLIMQQLQQVEQPYQNILQKHYLQGKKLGIVAKEMHYSYEHLRKMNMEALKKFDELDYVQQNIVECRT